MIWVLKSTGDSDKAGDVLAGSADYLVLPVARFVFFDEFFDASSYNHIVLSSPRACDAFLSQNAHCCKDDKKYFYVMGEKTQNKLLSLSCSNIVVSSTGGSEGLLDIISDYQPSSVLIVSGFPCRSWLEDNLASRGISVGRWIAYQTVSYDCFFGYDKMVRDAFGRPDGILSSSAHFLSLLEQLLLDKGEKELLDCIKQSSMICLPSHNATLLAYEMGFKRVSNVRTPSLVRMVEFYEKRSRT